MAMNGENGGHRPGEGAERPSGGGGADPAADPGERHPGTSAAAPAPPSPESDARADGAEVDVVVIGAGIQGVGVAQAAAARGLSVAVLERRAAAIGTSSRSSKLIHGGLRYLETFQLKLVYESLRERRTLLRIAPHLVRLIPFHVPVYRGMSRGPWTLRAGLTLYALLGRLRPTARFTSLPRREWDALDGLTTDGLRAVFRYMDGQTDDAALCRAVLASAIELGALSDAGAEVTRAEREGERWRVRYRRADSECSLLARAVVNAAGPWANRVNDLATADVPTREVDLVGGAHIEVAGTLERGVYYTEAPSDRRAVFSIPWKDRIMVGTTETPFDGDPATIAPTREEIDYLQGVHRRYFPGSDGPILDAWAGLRVLPRAEGSAFERPRDVTLVADDDRSWVTVYGGKLTGYRHTGEEAAALVAGGAALRGVRGERRADTETLRLPEPSSLPR